MAERMYQRKKREQGRNGKNSEGRIIDKGG